MKPSKFNKYQSVLLLLLVMLIFFVEQSLNGMPNIIFAATPTDAEYDPTKGVLRPSIASCGTHQIYLPLIITQGNVNSSNTAPVIHRSMLPSPNRDFDCNGFDDLAVGALGEDVGNINNAGAINIFYGSTVGISGANDVNINQDSPDVAGKAEAFDYFGEALSTGDFNGDGYADLAVGALGEAIGNLDNVGAINIFYGSSAGISGANDVNINQDSPNVAGGAEADDRFGSTLSTGDFNGDGYADLAVGAPGEDVGSIDFAGAINIFYGSSTGISGSNDVNINQDSPDVAGGAEAFDQFGEALSTGDFNGDDYADLVVGAPGEDVGNLDSAGAINIFYGSSAGISGANDVNINQDSPNVAGGAEVDDRFGGALSAGDFNGDGYADLAVGAPGEDVGSLNSAGAINIFYGSSAGISGANDVNINQDSPNVAGGAEVGDQFGGALTTGDFNGDGYADLAVGAPGEDVGNLDSAGAINIFYGSSAGISGANDVNINQDSPDVAGGAEALDFFGSTLSTGDFNGDGYADLVVGAPGENVGSLGSAGAINIFYGSSAGISGANDININQDSPDVAGGAEAGDQFGRALP